MQRFDKLQFVEQLQQRRQNDKLKFVGHFPSFKEYINE